MKIVYRPLFFISVGVIFWLSIVPAQSIPYIAALSFLTDKGIHFLIFLYLSFLGLISKFNIPNLILLATIFCFGLLIEVIHFYHPYRYFEIADLAANTMGILLAYYIFEKRLN